MHLPHDVTQEQTATAKSWRARVRQSRAWRVLMTPVGRRVPLGKNGAPHGVALLMVMVGLSLMSIVVTDLGYNEMVRYKLAAHDRDALKAQALAEGGLQFSRLLLATQAAIQPMVSQLAAAGIPLPAHTIWELVPLESDLMKGLTSGQLQSAFGVDVSAALEERAERLAEKHEEALDAWDPDAEGAGNAPFEPPAGGFGAFEGNFVVKIEDEERKAVSLRGWGNQVNPQLRFATAQRLYSIIQAERFDFLFEERDPWGNRTDRYELIANLYDWIDRNEDATDPRGDARTWGQGGGGSEDGVYSSYDDIEPKNAYFDSHAELARVRGMTDAHMRAFGDAISIYGENKINILSAPPLSIETLVRICAAQPNDPRLFDPIWMREIVSSWQACKSLGMLGGGCQVSPDGFVAFLQAGFNQTPGIMVNADQCKENISTESKNFVVKSTATVGDVTRTLTIVTRVHGQIEEIYHYQVR